MVQWLALLGALKYDLASVLSIQVEKLSTDYNSSFRGSEALFGALGHLQKCSIHSR